MGREKRTVLTEPEAKRVLAAYGIPVVPTLLAAATPVHGAWGSGRLLRTSLVSVLITDQGHAFVGAVQPSVLYAAAAAQPH